MAANSSIEWTEHTWNPCVGCEAVSPGCSKCYAATMTRRLEAMGKPDYAGLTTEKHFNGVVRCLPHKLDIPLKRRKPTTYFVNSMSDLFHENVPDSFIDSVFAVMAIAQRHTFQVLTKRAKRMADYLNHPNRVKLINRADFPSVGGRITVGIGSIAWPLPNCWLGVSTEDQKRADERIPWLLKTPAAVRFLSCEPLIGHIDLRRGIYSIPLAGERGTTLDGLDWVIVGGESGGGCRECDVRWVRSIVAQCKSAGVSCFVKQLGGHVVSPNNEVSDWLDECAICLGDVDTDGVVHQGDLVRMRLGDKKGGDPLEWPEALRIREFPSVTEAV